MPLPTPDSYSAGGTTVPLYALVDGRTRARAARVSVLTMPWSSNTVVVLGGKEPERLSLTGYVVAGTALTTLLALAGTQGTAVWAEGTAAVALVSVSSGDWLTADGQQTVKLEMMRTDG